MQWLHCCKPVLKIKLGVKHCNICKCSVHILYMILGGSSIPVDGRPMGGQRKLRPPSGMHACACTHVRATHARTHAQMRARARTHTHTHTHTLPAVIIRLILILLALSKPPPSGPQSSSHIFRLDFPCVRISKMIFKDPETSKFWPQWPD